MKKYKREKIGILLFLTVWLAAGCGAKTTGNPSNGDGQQAGNEKKTVLVAAAASMTDVLEELAQSYEKEHADVDICFTFGGSGVLQRQIEEGAPVDIFVSAASKPMEELEAEGVVEKGSRRELLTNEVVLIAPKGKTKVESFENILASEPKIALGDPGSVPAGLYAAEVFRMLGSWEEVQAHAVFASSVREVLAWVETGEVDCGVVYRTDALTSDKVEILCSAPEGAPVAEYSVALLRDSLNPEEGMRFLAFLESEEAKSSFKKYGFSVVDAG